MPVVNSLAVEELAEYGVEKCCAWVELGEEMLKALHERVGTRLEQWVYGRLPLLVTRAEPPVTGNISDSRGAKFSIRKEGDLYTLYSKKVLSITALPKISSYIDFSLAKPGAKETSSYNFEREMV